MYLKITIIFIASCTIFCEVQSSSVRSSASAKVAPKISYLSNVKPGVRWAGSDRLFPYKRTAELPMAPTIFTARRSMTFNPTMWQLGGDVGEQAIFTYWKEQIQGRVAVKWPFLKAFSGTIGAALSVMLYSILQFSYNSLAEYHKKQELLKHWDQLGEQLTEIQDQIDRISENTNLSPEDKKNFIDELEIVFLDRYRGWLDRLPDEYARLLHKTLIDDQISLARKNIEESLNSQRSWFERIFGYGDSEIVSELYKIQKDIEDMMKNDIKDTGSLYHEDLREGLRGLTLGKYAKTNPMEAFKKHQDLRKKYELTKREEKEAHNGYDKLRHMIEEGL